MCIEPTWGLEAVAEVGGEEELEEGEDEVAEVVDVAIIRMIPEGPNSPQLCCRQ